MCTTCTGKSFQKGKKTSHIKSRQHISYNYRDRNKITLFPLAQIILVNFQYIYKNYDKDVTTCEYPLVNCTEMTLHPYAVLDQDPDQVKLSCNVCNCVGFNLRICFAVQGVY